MNTLFSRASRLLHVIFRHRSVATRPGGSKKRALRYTLRCGLLTSGLLLSACSSSPSPTPAPTTVPIPVQIATQAAPPTPVVIILPTATPRPNTAVPVPTARTLRTLRDFNFDTRTGDWAVPLPSIAQLFEDALNDSTLIDFARGPFLTSYNIDTSANITGDVFVSNKDLDNDNISDAVLVLAPPIGKSSIHLFKRDGAKWKITDSIVREGTSMRVSRIQDINKDGNQDIVLLGGNCGAHTCFSDVMILNVQDRRFKSVLDASNSYAKITFQDNNRDGAEDVIVRGGLIGSAGAGRTRETISTYLWTGKSYELASRINDPVASAYPYWRLVDGRDALAGGNVTSATQFLELGLKASPEPGINPVAAANIVALIDLTLITSHVFNDDLPAAAAVFERTQKADAQRAPYASAFWRALANKKDNLGIACNALKSALGDLAIANAGYDDSQYARDWVCRLP